MKQQPVLARYTVWFDAQSAHGPAHVCVTFLKQASCVCTDGACGCTSPCFVNAYMPRPFALWRVGTCALIALLTNPAALYMDESTSSSEASSSESAEWWQRVPRNRLQVVRILPRDFHLESLFRNIHQEPNLHTYVLEPDFLNIFLSGSRILVLLPVRSWYCLTCSASWSNTCLRHLLARHV